MRCNDANMLLRRDVLDNLTSVACKVCNCNCLGVCVCVSCVLAHAHPLSLPLALHVRREITAEYPLSRLHSTGDFLQVFCSLFVLLFFLHLGWT